ncbi:MAG: RNA-binding transcriptional accessory protein, partial [Ignavibacteria bacterium]|nr:RNA-binding transcriptional accessory protein [Ignavibacteria bacterium]
MNITSVIARELNLQVKQVEAVINLLSEDATIPFIARYRKEHTGGLDEEVLRQIEDRENYLKLFVERRDAILGSIEEQGKLTEALKEKIMSCEKLQELEDLYLPYKPKRKTRSTIAKAKGLEPLALFMLETPEFSGDFDAKLTEFVNQELGVDSIEDALQGAKDILAEMISDDAGVRKEVREFIQTSS